MEILKQGQYETQSAVDQVMALRCGTSGALDTVSVEDVARFISEFIEHARASASDLVEKVQESGRLDDDELQELDSTIERFRETQFEPTDTGDTEVAGE